MELNRRNFIKLLVGGVAGIQVTPLPWKLTDDIAIWTQNWPWVPVPPTGAFHQVNSVCRLCPGGCGIYVRKVDDRAVKIEGRTDYPVNPGGICPVGEGGLQLLYDKDIRFTRPMKRGGPRGAGVFTDISWDEALGILTDSISHLRSQGKPEALAAVDGNFLGSTMQVLVERFMKSIGSPNYLTIPSCQDTFRMANILMLGNDGPMAYDIENSDFVLSFGSGPLEGWAGAGRVINAWSLLREKALKNKAKVVQIESRASNTASKADHWAAIKPGTEAALALGLAYVLIKENLYRTKFIQEHTSGFEDWTSSDGKKHMGFKTMVLQKYSPEQVERITGLKANEIVSLALGFAKAKSPVALSGKGKGDLNGSLYEFMSIMALNALAGTINQPGGIAVCNPLPLSPLPDMEQDAVAAEGNKKPRLDGAGGVNFPLTPSLINNFAEVVATRDESPVDTLLVFSSNPVYTLPDGGNFKRALKKIPFIVSFSPFRDETAFMADLILPDHTYLEKMDDMVWPSSLQYPLYGLSQPVVKPIYNTRHNGDVILELARKLGGTVGASFPWKTYEEVLKTRAKGLFQSGPGLVKYDNIPAWKQVAEGAKIQSDYKKFDQMWEGIKSNGLWYRPEHQFGNWDRLFKTPTDKFEFYSTQIELAINESSKSSSREKTVRAMGIQAVGDEIFMPHYEDPQAAPSDRDYPLLMVPYGVINLASLWFPNPPFVNKTLFADQLRKDDSFVEINPRTAVQYGLREGDLARIKTPSGELQVRATLFEGAMPGILYMLFGLGHTADDEFFRGKGVNPNRIVAPKMDPLSGHPIWWKTPARITKV